MKKITSIKVRMYRHGFGDCFLLRFFGGTTLQYKMLIDCGLKLNDKVDGVSLEDVAADIAELCHDDEINKPRIDVLVATHEHHDHVSGFHPSLALFDEFQFDEIWMAWTENPEDDEAKQINSYLRKGLIALIKAVEKLKEKKKKKKDAGFYASYYQGAEMLRMREKFDNTIADLVEFHGNIGVKATKTSESGIRYKDIFDLSIDTLRAFDHIRTKLAKGKSGIKYFEPGKLIDKIAAVPGIRMYVLGPPRGNMLNKENPSAGKKKEVYFSQSSTAMLGFINGVLSYSGYKMGLDDGRPFSKTPTMTAKEAAKDSWYKKNYFDKKAGWREIEDDWLDTAGSLALQMDGDTNNTSLVLAIEMIDEEKVLLFPGDAQVGNWLGWHDHEWEVKNGDKKETVNATTLLNKTVLYKVGHHASHNATLKKLGLELMTHEDLVALIPEKEKQYPGIPYSKLVTRLKNKTKGRVIFSADKKHPAEKVLKTKPTGLSPAEWKAFKENTEITGLYVEYRVR